MSIAVRASIVLVLVASISSCVDSHEDSAPTDDSTAASPGTVAPSSTATTTPTGPPVTATTTTMPPELLAVVPFGASGEFASLRIYETGLRSRSDASADGDVALTYELHLGFDPAGRSGTVEPASHTTDGQLAIEVSCKVDGCLSFAPRNEEIQASLQVTVRRTALALTAGEHGAAFRLRFDDGTTDDFTVTLFADPGPSAAISELVAGSTGAPARVQTVFGVGRFAYHAISAFDSIWVLGRNSLTVTRIDATTGAVLGTISIEAAPGSPGTSPSRLAAGSDAVYVNGRPVIRIDPVDNTATAITGGSPSLAVIADGETVWAGSYDGTIQRIDPDGTITKLDLPTGAWMDLAISNDMIWALSQARGHGRLIAFDKSTSELRHDIAVATDVAGYAVRLVADERSVVVGVDTSGGGGRTGQLLVVDPSTATITHTVSLSSRPEGIVLTNRRIWTSGAVLDRSTLAVTDLPLGFTITSGPDGSIWGTGGVPASSSGDSIAVRYAPGDLAG